MRKCLFPEVFCLMDEKCCGCSGEEHHLEQPNGSSPYVSICKDVYSRAAAFDLVEAVARIVPQARDEVVKFLKYMHAKMNFGSWGNVQTHGRRPPLHHIGLRNPGN